MMKLHLSIVLCLLCLIAAPLVAQTTPAPQIGGGACDSSTLNGNYSATLNGRSLSTSLTFSSVLQGVGTATFDGLSKVTFTFTNNTNKAFGVAQTLSGTYSLQTNCIGVINITSGDTATFTLGSYNQGLNYFIDGQDGIYSLLGNGNVLPSSCSASDFNNVYAFNGNGFSLASGAITGVTIISGLLTFDGTSAVTANWYVTANGTTATTNATGTYTVTPGCTATATVADSGGATYALVFTIGAAKANNFNVSGSNAVMMFAAAGRVL